MIEKAKEESKRLLISTVHPINEPKKKCGVTLVPKVFNVGKSL